MNRRTFLKKSVGAGLALSSLGSAANPVASRIVDAHTHFYDPTRKEGVPWPSEGTWLYRRVFPKDWSAVAAPLGVKETIVVEASAWLEDNAWILELAAREPSILGFVGHLAPDEVNFPRHLKRFGADPIFRGIRVSNDDFLKHCEEAEFRRGLGLMAEMGLELDVNGSPAILVPVAKLAAEVGALRIVVDHVGSAGDPARLSKEWREGMAVVGRQENVFCKVSGLIEQTDESGRRFGEARRETSYYGPILDHVWNCFGEDRLVYGSNWPVCEKGGSYADQYRIVTEYFGGKGRDVAEQFFWKNARAAYRWVDRG